MKTNIQNSTLNLSLDTLSKLHDPHTKKHILFLSFAANCIAIPILGSKEMSSMFNRLLTCLAIFDNIFIVCSVFDTIRKHWIQNQVFEYIFGYFLYQFHNMIVCCCTYITVVLALERYGSTGCAVFKRGIQI